MFSSVFICFFQSDIQSLYTSAEGVYLTSNSRLFTFLSPKSLGKICEFQSFSVTLPPNGGLPSVHCGVSMPWLIGKIEALCSFLQAENVRNFQFCRNFEEWVPNNHTRITKEVIAASRVVRGTATKTIFVIRVILTTLSLEMRTYSSTLLVCI